MALARKFQIIPGQAGFYHCYARCVRRAFLCGHDALSGRDFSHRRQWIVERLELLSEVFAIEVYAYAVMSNHWHVVVFVDPERVQRWSDEQVIERWRSIYRWRQPEAEPRLPTPEQVGAAKLGVWRERLCSISWFMKSLNEPLAHLANAEDECKGHFWQGRFGCTVLLDEPAVLAAMAYVDLNPIKAGLAESLAASDFTSIQQRLRQPLDSTPRPDATPAGPQTASRRLAERPAEWPLRAMFAAAWAGEAVPRLGVSRQGYLDLLGAAAAAHLARPAPDAPHAAAAQTLRAYALALASWLQAVEGFERLFRRAAGARSALEAFVAQIGRRRCIDATGARLLSAAKETV